MLHMINALQAWIATKADDDTGATMVEYALLIALIAVAVVIAATALGTGIATEFTNVTAKL